MPRSRPALDAARALAVALRLARAAGRAALARFRKPRLRVQRKPDASPVSEADHAADAILRRGLARAFPTHGVVTEESPPTAGDGRCRWIVDPLDGTMAFVRGTPHWCVLIALEVDGRIELGVMHCPALRTTLWARRGRGAFENGRRIRVSERGWNDAWVTHGQIRRFLKIGRARGIHDLAMRARLCTGNFHVLQYAALARGQIEAFCEAGSEVWDRAAPYIIVEEAGGRFTNLRGERTHLGPGAIASNGRLHPRLLASVGVKR